MLIMCLPTNGSQNNIMCVQSNGILYKYILLADDTLQQDPLCSKCINIFCSPIIGFNLSLLMPQQIQLIMLISSTLANYKLTVYC